MSKKLHCILLPFSESLSLLVSLFYPWQEKETEAVGVLAISLPIPWLCPVVEGRWLTGVSKSISVKGSGETLRSQP